MKLFSIEEALTVGWERFKNQWGFFAGLYFFMTLLATIPQLLGKQLATDSLTISILIIYLLIQYYLTAGFIKVCLKVVDGGKGRVVDLLSVGHVFAPFVLGTVLFFVGLVVGLVLLVVPAIIFGVTLQFFSYFIVDKRLGALKSFNASAALTKNVWWDILGFDLALILLNFAAALPLFVSPFLIGPIPADARYLLSFLLSAGLFMTVPVSYLASAFVYRKLLSQTQFT